MKNFASKASLFLLVNIAITACMLHVARLNTQDFMAAANDKHRRAASLRSPRLLLVGGSGTAFGADSRRISEALDTPVQNMGLSAALGMRFMLNEASAIARPGDVLLLSFAYQQYIFDNATGSALWRLFAHRPESLVYVDWPTARVLLDQGLNGIGAVARGGLRGLFAEPRHPYRRDSFNAYGDIVAHHDLPRRGIEHYEFRFYREDPDFRSHAMRHIDSVAKKLVQRRVRVLYAHPPIPRSLFARHRSTIVAVADQLDRCTTVEVIARPEDQLLADEMFFDTAYHLTPHGIELRTDFLIPRLRRALQ